MRQAYAALGMLVVALLLLPNAVAHGPGGVSTHLEGSMDLDPSGTSGDTGLLALSPLGEVEAGEELRYFWEINGGQGPAVRFAILQGGPGSTPSEVHGTTAPTVTETWMIPAHAEYTASWENPTSEAVTVSYLFEVLPPVASAVVDWPLYLGLGAAGVVFALLFFWSGRRKAEERDPPDTGEETEPRDR